MDCAKFRLGSQITIPVPVAKSSTSPSARTFLDKEGDGCKVQSSWPSQIYPSGGYSPSQMTPEHVAKLKPGDRIYAIRVHDPLSPGPRSCRGEVVAQLPSGI